MGRHPVSNSQRNLARFADLNAQTGMMRIMSTALPTLVGQQAPDFELRDQFGQTVRLSDFRERKSVLLLFYPWAFSGICTGELTEVKEKLDEFVTFDTEILALSCDPMFSLKAFADRDGLNFPLLSDFWPHGAVADQYAVFDSVRGCASRSSFVVDLAGSVTWEVHHEIGQHRDLDAHLAELRRVERKIS
jgi:mycoredoxin-dependent peroxiredoxin